MAFNFGFIEDLGEDVWIWVDPPSGWRYGFPKLKKCNKPMKEWLIENGYPRDEADFGTTYIRSWRYKDVTRTENERVHSNS